MKLITKELENIFKKYPIGSQDGLGGKAKVIAKFFNPTGAGTWLITETEKMEDGDYRMFGYCHLGDDEMAELGYVLLSELQNMKLPLGLSIERDLYLPEDCDLIQAMKIIGLEPPAYMLEKYEKEKEKKIMNKYESVAIISTKIGQEQVKETVQKFKKLLESFSDKKVKVDELGEKKLAYEIRKNKTGYYAVYYFSAQPEDIQELERNYRIDDSIMKFLTIKLEEENSEDYEDEETEEQ